MTTTATARPDAFDAEIDPNLMAYRTAKKALGVVGPIEEVYGTDLDDAFLGALAARTDRDVWAACLAAAVRSVEGVRARRAERYERGVGT